MQVITETDAVLAVLDDLVHRDPVRYTVFATIGRSLAAAGWDGWCATDGEAVAARSNTGYPVVLTDGWPDLGRLADTLAALPGLVGLSGPADLVDALAPRLGPVHARRAERLFRLDELAPDRPAASGAARPASPEELPLVLEWNDAFLLEDFGPLGAKQGAGEGRFRPAVAQGLVWLWTDDAGAPVSLAARHPVLHGVSRIGPVYTPRAQRGHGYGSAVTAAATAEILTHRAVPVLFTNLANPTSNKIYRALGYRPVEDRAAVWFG